MGAGVKACPPLKAVVAAGSCRPQSVEAVSLVELSVGEGASVGFTVVAAILEVDVSGCAVVACSSAVDARGCATGLYSTSFTCFAPAGIRAAVSAGIKATAVASVLVFVVFASRDMAIHVPVDASLSYTSFS